MIEIPETKDLQKIWSNIEKLNERTKKHTEQIEELKKELKNDRTA